MRALKFFPKGVGRLCASTSEVPKTARPPTDTVTIPWRSIGFFISSVGLAGGALGFVSNRAHKDNEMTRRELREDMKEMRQEMKTDMKEMRQELKTDMKEMRAEINQKFENVDRKFDELKDLIIQHQPPAPALKK